VIGDLLLSWMSFTGSGSVRELRKRVQWMARTSDRDDSRQAAGRWIRDISVLGHCEVDWRDDRWCIAPAVLSTLPHSDGRAILTGSRRPSLQAALDDSPLWVERISRCPSGTDLPMPTTVIATYDAYDTLTDVASGLGASFAGSAAIRLAARLRELDVGTRAAPPSWSSTTLEVLESFDPPRFVPTGPAVGTPRDGLYRMEVLGRPTYLWARGGEWYHCERSAGVFLDLARRRQSVMRYRPDGARGSQAQMGSVFVDWGAPLPPLHARSLALCSGLLPRFGQAGRTAIYENVPLIVARLVAASLSQQLAQA